MKTILVTIILSLFLFLGCNQTKKREYADFEKVTMNSNNQEHPGKKLMETNCYVCHSPTATMDDRIGPPMIAIKKHYISDNTTKEEFIADIQNWILNPNEEDAKMFGAVKKFGVMPKTPYPEETINQIADYMFDNDIEQPEWFEDHFNEERGMGNGNGKGKGKGQGMGKGKGMQNMQTSSENQELTYEEKGLKYALGTKAELGKNLMGTIQKKGTLAAVEYCNIKAYPLTDSMSVVYNANIKRVSDKPRNPENQANSKELQHIEAFKKVIANNQEPKPILEENEDVVNFYYPITTNSMCLQCHGSPNKELDTEAYKTIKALYPKDIAIGYDVNQVRGIWSITFEKD
jgi:nitrate reductase cytochrome c-type subunit